LFYKYTEGIWFTQEKSYIFLYKQVGVHTPSILLRASPLSPHRYKVHRGAKLQQK
jgi:hypothetical protein